MPEPMQPISEKDTFSFSCHCRIRCFNQCCRDLTQFLTPYDILRLKNRLGLSSGKFLAKFTVQHIGPQSGLPMVTFRTDGADGLKCPFVTEQGCGVYEDRPSSCRTYPLARLVSRSRDTGALSERYMLLKEAHCFGFEGARRQTVAEWIENQQIAEYNAMNDRILELIRLKNRYAPGVPDVKSEDLLRSALYDIDRFRRYALEKRICVPSSGDSDIEDMADDELLIFSVNWVQKKLFGGG
jgi:uncharacterized protein